MKRHSVVICDVKDPSAVAALQAKHTAPGAGKVMGASRMVEGGERGGARRARGGEAGDDPYWIKCRHQRRPVAMTTLSTSVLEAVVNVNLIGLMLCTKVALDVLQAQEGVTSHIFNTVGSGVKGGGTPGYVAYGATKRGLPQMTASLS